MPADEGLPVMTDRINWEHVAAVVKLWADVAEMDAAATLAVLIHAADPTEEEPDEFAALLLAECADVRPIVACCRSARDLVEVGKALSPRSKAHRVLLCVCGFSNLLLARAIERATA